MGIYSDKSDQHETTKKSRKCSRTDAKKQEDVKLSEGKVK